MLEPKCWHWPTRFWRPARIDYHIQQEIVVIALPVLVTMYAREQDNYAKMDPPVANCLLVLRQQKRWSLSLMSSLPSMST
jgi:hypothetical protein